MAEKEDTTAQKSKDTLRALVLGGTGAIGKCLVQKLVDSNDCTTITAIVRREVKDFPSSSKLKTIIVDMDKVKDHTKDFADHNVAFSCLGTTRKDAGSDAAFKKVDFDYVVNFATAAKEAGVNIFSVVSSSGASKTSWFLYPKTKGLMEAEVTNLKFDHLTIWRPGLLDRGQQARTLEKFAGVFMKKLPVAAVAEAMLINAIQCLGMNDKSVEINGNNKIYALQPKLPHQEKKKGHGSETAKSEQGEKKEHKEDTHEKAEIESKKEKTEGDQEKKDDQKKDDQKKDDQKKDDQKNDDQKNDDQKKDDQEPKQGTEKN